MEPGSKSKNARRSSIYARLCRFPGAAACGQQPRPETSVAGTATQDSGHNRPGPRRQVNGKNAPRSSIYARFCFLSPVPLFRAAPAGLGQAFQARDRGATPRLRLSGLTSGLEFCARAPQPRQGSILPRRALHSLGRLRRRRHTVSVPSHTCGRAWHLFGISRSL